MKHEKNPSGSRDIERACSDAVDEIEDERYQCQCLQCVAVYVAVFQCMLQCVAVYVAVRYRVLQCVAVLQCIAEDERHQRQCLKCMLQCGAVWCSVAQCGAV